MGFEAYVNGLIQAVSEPLTVPRSGLGLLVWSFDYLW